MTIHLPCKDCQDMVPVQVYDVRAIDIVTVLCDTCLRVRVTQVKSARRLPGRPSRSHAMAIRSA